MKFATVAVSLFSVTVCLPAFAQVIDACVKKDGSIRIVGSSVDCRSSESAISWNVTGPEGPQGPVGEPGPVGEQGPAGNNLWVVDGNGETVGQLVDLDIHVGESPYLTVYLASVQAVAEVTTENGSLEGSWHYSRQTLYFTELGCQGTAYTYSNFQDIEFVIPVTKNNVTRYFVDRPGQQIIVTVVSRAQNGVCSIAPGPTVILGTPAENVTDLIDVTFPLQVPLTIVQDGG